MKGVLDLVRKPGAWISTTEDTGVVVSSRIRLARNVRGVAFPGWAGEDECRRLRKDLCRVFDDLVPMEGAVCLPMDELDLLDREVLRERHLVSPEFTEGLAGSALVLRPDERVAVMINEEDHLRLQAIAPGAALDSVWDIANRLDGDIETQVEYAFSARLGYLTACPSNVGTGMRASMMIHLPGLKLMGEVDAVVKGLSRLGLAVRGLWGEGSDASGNMYQVSNQSTLGQSEAGIVAGLNRVVAEVVRQEENARARLLESRSGHLMDQLGRALGILTHARMLASVETFDLLSVLKLGVELERVKHLTGVAINEMIVLTQPAHLQTMHGKSLEPAERDELRSRLVRDRLRDVDVVN